MEVLLSLSVTLLAISSLIGVTARRDLWRAILAMDEEICRLKVASEIQAGELADLKHSFDICEYSHEDDKVPLYGWDTVVATTDYESDGDTNEN